MDSKQPGVAFSLGSKRPAAKVQIHDDDDAKRQRRELVTGVAANGVQLAEPPKDDPTGPRIIPKQADTFQSGGGRRAPGFVPSGTTDALEDAANKFETAAPEANRQVTYGLNRMDTNGAAPHSGTENGTNPAAANGSAVSTANALGDMDTARFRESLKALPADPSLEAYERMPVEDFGLALLRGMGWADGQGVGRKQEVIKPVEYVKRPHRLGLGATPAAPPTSDKKAIKPGETREAPKDLVYMDPNGQHKNVKTIDDALVERPKEGVVAGKRMHVVDGKHRGCTCVVVAVEPKEEGRSARATVRLLPSEETISVRVKELSDTPSSKEDSSKGGKGASSKTSQKASKEAAPWLLAHVRVRVVDKRLRGGRLYLKKGVVVDVAQPTVCDVVMDDTKEVITALEQSQLETVVPKKEGARVMIVGGQLRQRLATLLKKNNETGLAAVQLLDELSVEKLSLDDIAEYVGEDD